MAESPSGSSQFSASREIPFGVALFFSSDSGEKRHARLLRGWGSVLHFREREKISHRKEELFTCPSALGEADKEIQLHVSIFMPRHR